MQMNVKAKRVEQILKQFFVKPTIYQNKDDMKKINLCKTLN